MYREWKIKVNSSQDEESYHPLPMFLIYSHLFFYFSQFKTTIMTSIILNLKFIWRFLNFNLNATSTENILISKSGINTENKGDKHEGEITKIFFRLLYVYLDYTVCVLFFNNYTPCIKTIGLLHFVYLKTEIKNMIHKICLQREIQRKGW